MAEKIPFTISDLPDTDVLPNNDLDELLAVMQSNVELSKSIMASSAKTGRVADKVEANMITNEALARSISDWRPILSQECQVYVIGEQYIAKRFDQIHYKYMEVDEAKEVLVDNLYAILYYKYFPRLTDEIEKRVSEIVKGLTVNLKTFLKKIIINNGMPRGTGLEFKSVPKTAVAFTNGIYDFKANEFILKYQRIEIPQLNNTIILYPDYIINWNFDFDFDPLPINIMDTSFEEFIEMMKVMDATSKNYCFELFYNMSHDIGHKANMKRMTHLAQILGYTMVPQFLQYFVLLIGSGQNGKNSLFDGCFSENVTPKPVSNSMDSIEKDRFITSSLSNASHNIFLETSAKTYTDSNMLKALTGSMMQTIENKGVNKYQGLINCKYIFAGNDQSKIKFSDTTIGFRRRINIFEIFYSWDPNHRFLKYGDYYRTDFSGDLHEIKEDICNAVVYIYLGMYGIKSATKDFTEDFKFSYNDWNESYSDVDFDIKDFFDNQIKTEEYFRNWYNPSILDEEKRKRALYVADAANTRLQSHDYFKLAGKFTFNGAAEYLTESTELTIIDEDGNELPVREKNYVAFMKDNDLFISLIYLNALLDTVGAKKHIQKEFNDMFKKIYSTACFKSCSNREPYVKCRLVGGRIKFVES